MQPNRIHSRPHAGPQKGAAVILALLTVALVAGLAAASVGDLGVAMDQVAGRHDQAQARQLARGAVDWARNVLSEDARTSQVDHLGEAWAVKVPPTPVEEGEVSGELQELSGRLNLNNLASDGADIIEVERFQRLLSLVGVADADALNLTAALLDWLDADDTPRLPGGAEGVEAGCGDGLNFGEGQGPVEDGDVCGFGAVCHLHGVLSHGLEDGFLGAAVDLDAVDDHLQ